MDIKTILKKQGGFSLINNYIYNHVLMYAILIFFLIPKTTKGLELFREYINMKMYKRIKNKYKKNLLQYNKILSKEKFEKPKIIWFCWLQGLDNAPELVKVCYKNIKKYCKNYEIKLITSQNFSEYSEIPEYIIQKWKSGKITNAHFSDILRTSLLIKNGGTWIDSTVLLTGEIPFDIENASLFMFRTYKPGSDGKSINLSSWFLSSCPQNEILIITQKLLFEYWKKNNKLCDYFLFHIFMQIVLDYNPDYTNNIPKYTNETTHFLLFELQNQFDEKKWNSIINQSFCHKLTYKLDENIKKQNGTFYKKIIEDHDGL